METHCGTLRLSSKLIDFLLCTGWIQIKLSLFISK
jgi:hypothetical protein